MKRKKKSRNIYLFIPTIFRLTIITDIWEAKKKKKRNKKNVLSQSQHFHGDLSNDAKTHYWKNQFKIEDAVTYFSRKSDHSIRYQDVKPITALDHRCMLLRVKTLAKILRNFGKFEYIYGLAVGVIGRTNDCVSSGRQKWERFLESLSFFFFEKDWRDGRGTLACLISHDLNLSRVKSRLISLGGAKRRSGTCWWVAP